MNIEYYIFPNLDISIFSIPDICMVPESSTESSPDQHNPISMNDSYQNYDRSNSTELVVMDQRAQLKQQLEQQNFDNEPNRLHNVDENQLDEENLADSKMIDKSVIKTVELANCPLPSVLFTPNKLYRTRPYESAHSVLNAHPIGVDDDDEAGLNNLSSNNSKLNPIRTPDSLINTTSVFGLIRTVEQSSQNLNNPIQSPLHSFSNNSQNPSFSTSTNPLLFGHYPMIYWPHLYHPYQINPDMNSIYNYQPFVHPYSPYLMESLNAFNPAAAAAAMTAAFAVAATIYSSSMYPATMMPHGPTIPTSDFVQQQNSNVFNDRMTSSATFGLSNDLVHSTQSIRNSNSHQALFNHVSSHLNNTISPINCNMSNNNNNTNSVIDTDATSIHHPNQQQLTCDSISSSVNSGCTNQSINIDSKRDQFVHPNQNSYTFGSRDSQWPDLRNSFIQPMLNPSQLYWFQLIQSNSLNMMGNHQFSSPVHNLPDLGDLTNSSQTAELPKLNPPQINSSEIPMYQPWPYYMPTYSPYPVSMICFF